MKMMVTSLLLLCSAALLLCSTTLSAQTMPHAKGIAHTEQVDIAYETLGTQGAALPIIAINGGPGLSHAYMVQNDLWERIAKTALWFFMISAASAAPSVCIRAHRNPWTRM